MHTGLHVHISFPSPFQQCFLFGWENIQYFYHYDNVNIFTDDQVIYYQYFSFLAHFDVTEVNTCLLSLLFSMCLPLFVIKFSQFNLHRTVKRIKKPIRSSRVPALVPEMLVTTALWVSLRGPLGGPWVLCVQANFPDPTSSSFLADALLREVLPPAAPWREAHRKCIPWRNGTPEMCTWLSHITDNLADSELHVGNLFSWIAREIWHTVFQRPLCCYKDTSNPISWSFLLM